MKTFEWLLLFILIIGGMSLIIFEDDDDYSRVIGTFCLIVTELRIFAYLNI